MSEAAESGLPRLAAAAAGLAARPLAQPSAIEAALVPAIAVLGFALPLTFLCRVEQYLYYLRPLELVPTYATAWLLLALLCVPALVVTVLLLPLLRRLGLTRLARALPLLLWWAAVAVSLASALLFVCTWVESFDPQRLNGLSPHARLYVVCVAAIGALVVIGTRAGRLAIAQLRSSVLAIAIIGGLLCGSLPVFRWSAETGAPLQPRTLGTSAAAARPNVLLLTIDDLSAAHMSLYGALRDTTPSLASFARSATVFDRAHASANFTTPAISSILTGTRPWTHRAFGITSWPAADARGRSMPALLSAAGYRLGYVATNGYAGATRLGFGRYFTFAAPDRMPILPACPDGVAAWLRYECAAAQTPLLLEGQKIWNRVQSMLPASRANRHYDPSPALGTALDWLSRVDRDRPLFLWVHLFPPHAPYAAPRPWIGVFDPSPEARTIDETDPDDLFEFGALPLQRTRLLTARYDEAVRYLDAYVGEFLARALAQLGRNTVVVVAADHGESFEHGYGGHGGPGLYESITHVPLIIRLPGQSRGARVSTPVEQVDIAPTLAELAGLEAPQSWEGRSLLPLLQAASPAAAASSAPAAGSMPAESRPVFSMNFEQNPNRGRLRTGSVAAIEGRWKLIEHFGTLRYPRMPQLNDELYDLSSDPGELKNVALDVPEVREHLHALIAGQLALHGAAAN